jgi:uncharacterized protein
MDTSATGVLSDTAGPDPGDVLGSKFEALATLLESLGQVVVAFSGGADSALLAHTSNAVLGSASALCVTAVSPSLAPEERADCRELAAEWGLEWLEVNTSETEYEAYATNGRDRCYHCKANLMDALVPLARRRGATVVLGVNTDDLGDHRPGQKAASERGARFPFVEVGLDKKEVRELSRRAGLRTWDKPAAACLSSRVPYGTRVDIGTLEKVAKAESALKALGFRQLRVRHYGDLARLELDLSELPEALARRVEVVDAVRGAGYSYVTLDLEGFRSGNLNGTSARQASSRPPGSGVSPGASISEVVPG